MTGWDWLSWASVAVLGPGSLVVFVLFLRGARALLDRDGERDRP